jgi:hypothetical protein
MRNQTNQVSNVSKAASKAASNAAARNAQRIATLLAARAAKNAVRRAAANQQAFMVQVAQLSAQYGVPAPSFAPVVARNARANSATVAPSATTVTVQGVAYKPCKAVHALCATLPATATRAQQMQLCTDNGINRATASTQVAIYRKAAAQSVQ